MDLFVARQPIFDRGNQVRAYELLFRAGPENYFVDVGESYSTSRVLSSQFVFGLGTLTEGKPAFVNFTRETLVHDFAFALPSPDLVVEILETVEPDDEVIAACRRLKKAGYRIALDDFVESPHSAQLLPFADIVKVDVLATGGVIHPIATRLAPTGCRLLAEKVETHEVHQAALAANYHLFQGYFFSKPTVHKSTAIPGFRLNYLRLLQALSQPDTTISKLEEIVKQEASMTYRFLRRVNSALYGFRTETTSLRHALVLLGEKEIRACATVWTMAELGKDQPAELVVSATVRGRFCETLGPHAGLESRTPELFLVGLFSMLEVIMQRPMGELLGTLPLASDVTAALLGESNPLRRILDCVLSYERADWERLRVLCTETGLNQDVVPTCYLDSLQWASSVFGHDQARPGGASR